jgi:hypothetical protein
MRSAITDVSLEGEIVELDTDDADELRVEPRAIDQVQQREGTSAGSIARAVAASRQTSSALFASAVLVPISGAQARSPSTRPVCSLTCRRRRRRCRPRRGPDHETS